MKHNNIANVLGWSEVEDFNEGVHLQPVEAANVDAKLGELATALQTANDATVELGTANSTITTLQGEISTLTTTAAASATTITNQQNEINALKEQVKELGGKSSGNGSTLKVEKDDAVEEVTATGKGPRYDSPDHPANKAARARGFK